MSAPRFRATASTEGILVIREDGRQVTFIPNAVAALLDGLDACTQNIATAWPSGRYYWAAAFTAIGEFLASVDATCTPIGNTSRVCCDGEASFVVDNLINCALIARRDGEGLTRWTRHS